MPERANSVYIIELPLPLVYYGKGCAAGLSWTLSSELVGCDAVNYGVWYHDVQLVRIALKHTQIAKALRVEKIVVGERGHTHKATICWNTAVRLVAKDSPVVPQLKRLEQQGVEILAGMLCLENLALVDKIAVGKPTTMPRIRDLLLHNEVITL